MSNETKACTRCSVVQPLDQFYLAPYPRKDGTRKHRSICRDCWREDSYWSQKKYRKTAKGRAYHRQKRHRENMDRAVRRAAERAETIRMLSNLLRKTKARGFTSTQLAMYAGIDRSTIERYAAGRPRQRIYPHIVPSIIRGCQIAERIAEQRERVAFVPQPPKPKPAPTKPRRVNNSNHPWRQDENARVAAIMNRSKR